MTLDPLLFVCDSVAWRLDLFCRAIGRMSGALSEHGAVAGLLVGYRARDDLAVLVCDGVLHADELRGIAALPGLRALTPHDETSTVVLAERALDGSDVRMRVSDAADLELELRAALGLADDPRAAVRVAVRLNARFLLPSGWCGGVTRDLSSGGLFIQTLDLPETGTTIPLELTAPGTTQPIVGMLTVVRLEASGFGGRLLLLPDEEAQLVAVVRRLRPAPLPDRRRREQRVPARLAVRFADPGQLVRAWTANLSSGGVFIRTDDPPESGQTVRLTLELPNGEEYEVDARVTYVARPDPSLRRAAGCGVVFESVPDAARAWIDTYLAAALASPRVRALVADGNPSRRAALSSALLAQACAVDAVATGHEALHRLRDGIFGYDALVIGLDFADLTGRQLLASVRATDGDTALPVIVLDDRPDTSRRVGVVDVVSSSGPLEVVAARVVELAESARAVA